MTARHSAVTSTRTRRGRKPRSTSSRSSMSERVRIGRVGRPHGIDGSFFVEQPSEDTRWWKTGATFLAGADRVEVVGHRTSSGRPVVKLDKDVARGTFLEIEREQLPPT